MLSPEEQTLVDKALEALPSDTKKLLRRELKEGQKYRKALERVRERVGNWRLYKEIGRTLGINDEGTGDPPA